MRYEVRTMFLHMDFYGKASLISVSLPKSDCPISPSFLDPLLLSNNDRLVHSPGLLLSH